MSNLSQNIKLPFTVARILLAEDLMINQELTRRSLESVGHQVDVVMDGASALAAAQNGCYDLILMDIQMPVMDGIAATECIRASDGPNRSVPIIALTSHTHPLEVAKLGPAGMNSYLAKPYSDHELYALVDLWRSEGAAIRPAEQTPAAHPALDLSIYQVIEQMIAPERIHAIFVTLRKAFCERIEIRPATGQERLRTIFALHSLVSQAGQVGFVMLSDAARNLENLMTDGRPCDAAFEEFAVARDAALTEVNRRLAS